MLKIQRDNKYELSNQNQRKLCFQFPLLFMSSLASEMMVPSQDYMQQQFKLQNCKGKKKLLTITFNLQGTKGPILLVMHGSCA